MSQSRRLAAILAADVRNARFQGINITSGQNGKAR
jgi:hypothetical protein